MLKEVTFVRIDPEIKRALENAAQADGRTLSGLISKICTEWLNPSNTALAPSPIVAALAARNKVTAAIATGRLVAQPCERCGAPKTHAHHEDYSKPLEVVWLCPKHHRARHAELRRQARSDTWTRSTAKS